MHSHWRIFGRPPRTRVHTGPYLSTILFTFMATRNTQASNTNLIYPIHMSTNPRNLDSSRRCLHDLLTLSTSSSFWQVHFTWYTCKTETDPHHVQIHVPASLLVDFQTIYPAGLLPSILQQIPPLYIQMSNDPLIGSIMGFFGEDNTKNMTWFKSFLFLEAWVCLLWFSSRQLICNVSDIEIASFSFPSSFWECEASGKVCITS